MDFTSLPGSITICGVLFELLFVTIYQSSIEKYTAWWKATVGGWSTIVEFNPMNCYDEIEGTIIQHKLERHLARALVRQTLPYLDPKNYYGEDFEEWMTDNFLDDIPLEIWDFYVKTNPKYKFTIGELGCHF